MNIRVIKGMQESKDQCPEFKIFCKESLICPVCHRKFDKINLEYDFEDYTKGLEVHRWCPHCHAEWIVTK